MSQSQDGSTAAQSPAGSFTAGNPQRQHPSSSQKKHQLTVPNQFSRSQIRAHLSRAFDTVAEDTRVAVFEPAARSQEETLVVSNDIEDGSMTVTTIQNGAVESAVTQSEADAFDKLTEIAMGDTTGEFFTLPAVGGCEVKAFKTI